MADKRLSFIIDAENRTKEAFDEVNKQLGTVENKLESMQPAFKKMAAIGTAGFAAISGALGFSIKEAISAEAEFVRLEHILKTASNATDQNVNALVEQAEALERVGVVSKGATMIAQGQLGTFNLQAENIQKLIPSILDYAVAEKGASVSSDELKSMTNGLAQALNGNFASLTRVGFVLDDNTKELISNGTESQRVEALVKVLGSTYDGFNERARNTAEGGMVALRNSFNQVKESIGNALLPIMNTLVEKITPVIDKIAQWAQKNPELVSKIGMAALAITGIIAVVGTLGMVLPTIIGIFDGFIAVLGFILTPIGAVIAAIGLLVAAGIYLWKNWDTLKENIVVIWEGLATLAKEVFTAIADFFVEIWNAIKESWSSVWIEMATMVVEIWEKIKSAVSASLMWVKNKFIELTTPIAEAWHSLWEGLGNAVSIAWEAVKNTIKAGINWIIGAINTVINTINKVVKAGAGIFGLKAPQISTIPLLAEGGIVQRPTLAVIGEAGPEAVVPLNRASMAGAGIGGNITINITGNEFMGEEGIAERIGNQIMRALKDTVKL